MRAIFILLLLFLFNFSKSQISFNDLEVLNDMSYETFYFLDLGDINNDDYPEFFFTAQTTVNGSTNIFWLSNEFGDFKKIPRKIHNGFGDNSFNRFLDVDNDGLLDIVVAQNLEDLTYSWSKNLGGDNFSENYEFLLNISLENRSASLFFDYNEDGYVDYFSATIDGEVFRYTNLQGNGFSEPELVFNTDDPSLKHIVEIKFLDFNQDGYEDLLARSLSSDYNLYLNNGNGHFEYHIPIMDQANEYGLNFFDFDNNSIIDFLIYDKYDFKIRTFFYYEENEEYYYEDIEIDNPLNHFFFYGNLRSKLVDYNQDGLIDIFITTGPEEDEYTDIYYYKNLGNMEFAEKVLIKENIYRLNDVKIEDFNSDDLFDFFLIKNTNYDPNYKLMLNEGNNTFNETVVERIFRSSDKSFFFDFNNDGNIDIFNGKNGLLWYENYGDDEWSGRRFISSLDIDFRRNIDYELIDVNNDGLFDVISNETDGDFSIENEGSFFSIYKNLGNQEFEKIFSLDYDYLDHWHHYEVFKNQDELFPDVYFTKPLFNEESEVDIFYIKNNAGNFEQPVLSTILPIGTIIKPLHSDFKMTDLNNDGLPEIVYLDNDYQNQLYRLNYLENLGDNTFRKETVGMSSDYIGDQIFSIDYDSDGDQDLFIGGDNYSFRDFWVYENEDMVFTKKLIDENVIVDDVIVDDVNNDGLLDVLTLGYYGWNEPEYSYHYVIFYYQNQGNGQYEKLLINQFDSYFNNDDAFDRGNIYLHDKNLDGKLDILVSCSDDGNTIRFYLNTSNLEVIDQIDNRNLTKVYPNPFSEVINWKSIQQKNSYDVTIYDLTGKSLFDKNINSTHLDLSFLEKGIYILKIDDESFKVIKK